MRWIRKSAAFPFSKIVRIVLFISVCCFCLLGIKTFLSIEETATVTAASRKHAGDHLDNNSDDVTETLDIDTPSAKKSGENNNGNGAINSTSTTTLLDVNLEEYPGWREDTNLVNKQPQNDAVNNAKPVLDDPGVISKLTGKLSEGRFMSQGQFIRPFPGDQLQVEESVRDAGISGMEENMQQYKGFEELHQQASNWQMANGNQQNQMGPQPVPVNNAPGINQPLQPASQVVFQPHLQNSNAASFPLPTNSFQVWPPNSGFISAASSASQNQPLEEVHIQQRIVHFDLKGAPPKITYYKEIFPLLRKLGATGVLMEYEDMFPYTGKFKVVTAKNAYTKNDIALINQLARENELDVIPLVPTFGHLEFVLKHKEFKKYREVEMYASAVCPTRNGTFQMVTELIGQMMALHPNVTYLHFGADEVYHLGQCDTCRLKTGGNSFLGPHNLFLSYIAQILTHIRITYPSIRPIMWDDMFHNMHPDTITQGLGDLVNYVEPMIWSYFTDWTRHLPRNGDLYGKIFPNIWGATAFKGSDGETRQMPDINTQTAIHTSWIEALKYNGGKFQNFRGIVLSGWSRYDHFYPLCELFPLAMPTLAINLHVMKDSELTLKGVEEAAKILSCQVLPNSLDFMRYDPILEQFTSCQFPGVEIYRSVHMIEGLKKPVKDYLEELSGRYPEYQMREQYLQAWRAEEQLGKLAGYEQLYFGYVKKAKDAFLQVYDEAVFNEWIAANVEPLLKKLQSWKQLFEATWNVDTWPSRPLNIPPLPEPETSTLVPAVNPFIPNNINIRPPLFMQQQQQQQGMQIGVGVGSGPGKGFSLSQNPQLMVNQMGQNGNIRANVMPLNVQQMQQQQQQFNASFPNLAQIPLEGQEMVF